MAGRETMGILRATFLLDPQGITCEVWDKVKLKAHAATIHQTLCNLT